MRLIPCRSVKCNGEPATFKNGEPQIAGRHSKRVQCATCGSTTFLTAADFARLPVLSVEDFARLARKYNLPRLAGLPTQDFEGAGFTKEQAADLFHAGFRGNDELDRMGREGE